MRDLWKALTLLSIDTKLREAVFAKARFVNKPELREGIDNPEVQALNLSNQPDIAALRAIDQEYRKRGVFLGPYALAEINRWARQDEQKRFGLALEAFRQKIAASIVVALTTNDPGFLETVGALVADQQLRDMFGKNDIDLRQNGFVISQADQDALRNTFVPGSRADELADEIFRVGWSGSCASTALIYEGYLHSNM